MAPPVRDDLLEGVLIVEHLALFLVELSAADAAPPFPFMDGEV